MIINTYILITIVDSELLAVLTNTLNFVLKTFVRNCVIPWFLLIWIKV
jgi:hypothetical protein